jgi:uncharacterized protein YecA (UPF0149 family)
MIYRIHENIFKSLTRLRLQTAPEAPAPEVPAAGEASAQSVPGAFTHKDRVGAMSYSSAASSSAEARVSPQRRKTPKVGRNEKCPCGSGEKYKNCCGRRA